MYSTSKTQEVPDKIPEFELTNTMVREASHGKEKNVSTNPVPDFINELEKESHFVTSTWDMWLNLTTKMEKVLEIKGYPQKSNDNLFSLNFIREKETLKFQLKISKKEVAELLGINQKEDYEITYINDVWDFYGSIITRLPKIEVQML